MSKVNGGSEEEEDDEVDEEEKVSNRQSATVPLLRTKSTVSFSIVSIFDEDDEEDETGFVAIDEEVSIVEDEESLEELISIILT